MKPLIILLTILVPIFGVVIPARGNTYYFSATNGDDSRSPTQAMQVSSPWRSLGKLNQVFAQLQPGDSVLFKRGEVFYGAIVAGQSGVAGKPIVFAAYGQGYDPIISGFSRLSGWKSGGNGIWQAPCQGCRLRVNMVTIEDTVQPMGRFPNSGYSKIQGHTANTSITDANLAGGPDWTGADVVIRKNRFILDRSTIISQQGSTLNYKGGSFYPATDKFGYFVQNDIRTLDQPGEWYYDPKSRIMNIYFGSGQPAPDIMASSVDTLVSIRNKQYLMFKGLTFLGSNGNAFFLSDAANITISFCRILYSASDGVCAIRSTNLTLANLSIDHSDDDGISIIGTGSLVTDCTVRHSGNVPGMGNPEHSYFGINIGGGSNNTVQYNTVDTSGYVGIFFLGGPNIIKNNAVDYFCYIKDDGGGLYTWSGDIDSATPRKTGIVTGNVVLNGITATSGTDSAGAGIADGIYLDENTGQIEVSYNTVAHCTSGIFVQDSHEAVVKNNTLYDNGAQLEIRHALAKGTLRNNDISFNTAVAAKTSQTVLLMSSGLPGDLGSFANLHDNYYGQVAGSGPLFRTSRRQDNRSVQDKGALGDFQARYGKETNSVVAPPAAAIRFEYNASKNVKVVALDRTYADAAGKTYQGSLKLAPYTSVVLMPK
jgi:parallel beta-helix repeat protein